MLTMATTLHGEDTKPAFIGNVYGPMSEMPVPADAPPLLLLTGDKDSVVKPRNSKVLSERIAALGGKQQLKIYPDVGHSDIIMAVARPFRNKASVIHDVTTFIKAHEPR